MLKLAREHDPEAKLTNVHIGDYDPQNLARYSTSQEHVPEQYQFPGFARENPAGPGKEIVAHSRPEDIMMGPWGGEQRILPSVLDDSTPRPVYHLVDEDGQRVGGWGGFASRAAAERALQVLQRDFDRAGPDLKAARAQYDISEEPAIAMTDKMRQSILERGFPLFVNPPTAGMAGFLNQPSPTTAGGVLDREYGDRGQP